MKLGYVQFNPKLGAVDANFETMERLAGSVRADLLVFPELATCGYALGNRERAAALAMTVDGDKAARLTRLARRIGGYLVVGVAERTPSSVFNSSLLVGPAGVEAVYRKTHLFWAEKELFEPGNTGFVCRLAGPARVGMMVCFDWAFPEAAGTLARRGAQVIAHPSNLVLPHAQRAMPIRCLENRVFAVTCNRYGEEPSAQGPLRFSGRSMIIAPDGTVIAEAPRTGDHVAVVEIDPARADDKNLTPENHLVFDRRPEFYE